MCSDGLAKVWEVGNEVGDATIREISPITYFCWLEPEELLAITEGTSVHIRDVVAGTVLRSFVTADPISSVIYSQELDWLAIATRSRSGNTVIIIDPQAGTSSVLPGVREMSYCFAFSRTTKELLRCIRDGGLEMFSFSTWR